MSGLVFLQQSSGFLISSVVHIAVFAIIVLIHIVKWVCIGTIRSVRLAKKYLGPGFVWIRRIFITIWFWFWTILATILLQAAVYIFGAREHNSITFLIENLMANMIFLSMTLPRIWKFNAYNITDVDENDYSDANGPFLLASTHNSIVDTLFMALFPSKKSYTFNLKWSWIPIFGPLCLRANYIGINTSDSAQKANVVKNTIERMNEGYSIMIYPQGSRSLTPEKPITPEDLKHGTFTIAKEGGFKILPIAIEGTDKAMMRGGWCDVATIRFIVGKPFNVIDIEQGKKDYCKVINDALLAKLKA
jgi:1-acyl-sn-glycerol-3-phosphate acyltransferase